MSKVLVEGKTYWRDAKGNLTAEELIREIDKERDALVRELIEKGKNVNQVLRACKADMFGDIQAFIELSAEKYGASLGGKKGNVILYSYDGKYKIQRSISDRIQFDERILAAKSLIDDCLEKWSEGASPELKALIEQAFNVDKEGNLSASKILGLRRVDIQDADWLNAMRAINESIQIVSSKAYVRLFERVGDSDEYMPIPLDIAGV